MAYIYSFNASTGEVIVAATPDEDLSAWTLQSYTQSGNQTSLLDGKPIDLGSAVYLEGQDPITLVYYSTVLILPAVNAGHRKAISLTNPDGSAVEVVGWGRDTNYGVSNGPAQGTIISAGNGTYAGTQNSGWFVKTPPGVWNGTNASTGNGLPSPLVPYPPTPPCFAEGTLILTPSGERPVEELAPGDCVLTPSGTTPIIRWTGRRTLALGRAGTPSRLRPVRIAAHAFGRGRPHRDLRLSPQHRVLCSDPRADLWFGAATHLVPACHLVDGDRIAPDLDCTSVTYHHLLFDRHETLLSNGLPTESLHPGDRARNGLDAMARAELFALFPELATGDTTRWRPAHPTLRAHEARVLFAAR